MSMIKVTFPDGAVKEFEQGISVKEVAENISKSLAKKALAIFSKHGVTRPSSDSLTDDLITDLKSIMAGED